MYRVVFESYVYYNLIGYDSKTLSALFQYVQYETKPTGYLYILNWMEIKVGNALKHLININNERISK